MKTTITQISNIFNLLSQIDVRIFNYHHGYRYDINQNITNNFDPSNDTGRLFPAVMFDVPDNVKYVDKVDYIDVQEEIQVTLYFDDLQGYNNDGSQNVLNPVEQWQRLKQIAEDFLANFRYLFEEKYGAGSLGLPTFVPRSNLYNLDIITWEVSFQLIHAIPCTEDQYIIDENDFPDTLDEDDLERTTGTPPTACDRIISQLNDTLLLTCVLPLYNFAQTATQNALSVQQVLDLKTWLLPQYAFSDSVWQNLLTTQQKIDLVDYLLPSVDFTDAAIQSLLSTQQKNDIIEWLFPLLDFTSLATQALVTPQQQSDLQAWLCTPYVPPQACFDFDGVSEYINFLYDSNHEIERTDRFTLFAWIKIDTYKTSWICSKYDQSVPRRGYFYRVMADGTVAFNLTNDISTNGLMIQTTVPLSLNTWHLLAVTSDGSSLNSGLELYDNGVLQTTNKTGLLAATTISPTKNFKIGGNVAGGFFDGKIALVGLFKGVTLTPAEIVSLQAVPYPRTTIYPSNQVLWVDMAQSIWYSTSFNVLNQADTLQSNGGQTVLMENADKITNDNPS